MIVEDFYDEHSAKGLWLSADGALVALLDSEGRIIENGFDEGTFLLVPKELRSGLSKEGALGLRVAFKSSNREGLRPLPIGVAFKRAFLDDVFLAVENAEDFFLTDDNKALGILDAHGRVIVGVFRAYKTLSDKDPEGTFLPLSKKFRESQPTFRDICNLVIVSAVRNDGSLFSYLCAPRELMNPNIASF